MFVSIGKSCIFALLFERGVLLKEVWRGGRVVDYSGLENRRTATFRGFESLPLREGEQSFGCSSFVFTLRKCYLDVIRKRLIIWKFQVCQTNLIMVLHC